MEPAGNTKGAKLLKTWWPGTELNRRRQPFQGCALPPELPGHVFRLRLCAGSEFGIWQNPSQRLGSPGCWLGASTCGSLKIITIVVDSLNARQVESRGEAPQLREIGSGTTQPDRLWYQFAVQFGYVTNSPPAITAEQEFLPTQ